MRYNHLNDSEETNNIVDVPENAELVKQLSETMHKNKGKDFYKSKAQSKNK